MTANIGLNEMQKQVDDRVSQYPVKYFPQFEIMNQLIEELGEVGREVAHLHGVKKKKSTEEAKMNLGGEIADMLFALICLANSNDIDLEKERQKILEEKMYGRDKDRFK